MVGACVRQEGGRFRTPGFLVKLIGQHSDQIIDLDLMSV